MLTFLIFMRKIKRVLLTYVYDIIVCRKEQMEINKEDIILNLAKENNGIITKKRSCK